MMARPGIAEIAVSETQRAQAKHLEKKVKNDGDPAEKEVSVNVRSDEDIVEHQQREGQHRSRAQDVQRVRQRNETPFGRGELEEITDDDAERDEPRHDPQQQRQPLPEHVAFETQIEAGEQRKPGRERVMRRNQQVAQGQLRETPHFRGRLEMEFAQRSTTANSLCLPRLPAVTALPWLSSFTSLVVVPALTSCP